MSKMRLDPNSYLTSTGWVDPPCHFPKTLNRESRERLGQMVLDHATFVHLSKTHLMTSESNSEAVKNLKIDLMGQCQKVTVLANCHILVKINL